MFNEWSSQFTLSEANIELSLLKTLTETDKTTHSKISSNFLPVVLHLLLLTCSESPLQVFKYHQTFFWLVKEPCCDNSQNVPWRKRSHNRPGLQTSTPHGSQPLSVGTTLNPAQSQSHTYSFYSTLLPWQPHWRNKLQLLLACSSVSSLHVLYKTHLL